MSESNDAYSLELSGLDKIMKSLKGKLPIARIGILGGAASAPHGKDTTNGAVGAAHEFGTTRLPQRSFLRVPLTNFLDKQLEGAGLLDENTLKQVIKEGSALPWLKKIAIVAEKVVQGAFDSNGYGQWQGWKNGYVSNTGQILVNTQQLRNSITSEVK